MTRPHLRIINNNLELDRQPVARLLDVHPTLMDRLEKHITEIDVVMQQVEDLTEKVNKLKKEIDNHYA
tara:strand:+ start:4816 stop:5019 length:204 start_codon:yes stop_codon:yes gene_type:complete